MKRILVILAEGAEEMETVIIVDVLRRAKLDVTLAGLSGASAVKCSRGMTLVPDKALDALQTDSFDAVVLPGGKGGTDLLMASSRILDTVRSFCRAGKLVAAVCAAPLVLQAAGVLDKKKVTCHPGVRNELKASGCSNDKVVIDGNILTSQGPGTTFDFALAIIEKLEGKAMAAEVAAGMVYKQKEEKG